MPKRRLNKFDSTYTKKKWKNRQSRGWRSVSFSYGGYWTPPTGGGRLKKAAKKDKKREIGQYIESVMKMQYDDYNGWIDDEIYAYSDPDDTNDTDWYYNYDNIPIWNCPICSYENVERLSFCSFCNHPYYDRNINKKTKETNINKQKHNECIDKKTEKCLNLRETDDCEIYKHYYDDMIWKIEVSRIQRKLLNILLPEKTINILHERINDLQIECIINDHWLKKLNLKEINEDNIIYIKEPSRWYRISKGFCTISAKYDYSKDLQIINHLLKYNAMIKMCDMQSFVNTFLTTYDFNIFVPTDITKLCLLFCGIIPQLLPFASITMDMSSIDNINIAKFQNNSFDKFDYSHDTLRANQWLRGRQQYYKRKFRIEWEIFIGIIIGNINHIESNCINYSNVLPIFSIQRLSNRYLRHQNNTTKWIGWLSKFEAKDVAANNNFMNTNDIIKLKYAHNKERFDSINDKRILKFVKKRDQKRYLGRKWSAYNKLTTY